MAAETGKQLISSGSSSDESDHVKDEGASSTLRRSFECTFCKRGFTNAQALGGHMNIHRKDRAKAKKATASTKNTNSYPDADPSSYLMSYRQIAPNMSTSSTTDHSSRFGIWEAQRPAMMSGGFHMYHPSTMSGSLINLPTGGNYFQSEPVRPSQHEMGSNLSLRVGADTSNIAWNNNIDNDNHEEDNNEDVDLELRLGPR